MAARYAKVYRFVLPSLIVFYTLLSAADSFAHSALDVSRNPDGVSLQSSMEVLEDNERKLTIDDVANGKYSDAFVESHSKHSNFGYTHSAIWARFSVENRSGREVNWLLELANPFFTLIELYIPDGEGGYKLRKTGNSLPFVTRDIKQRNYVFSLNEGPESQKTYYIHLESDLELILTMEAWSPENFDLHIQRENFLFGAYFGILLVMMAYNFILYLSIRDRNYLYYVVYLAFMWLSQFSYTGLAYQYAWPESYNWHPKSIMVFTAGTIVSGMIFSRSFLESATMAPVLDRILKFILLVSFLCFFLSFIVDYKLMGIILNYVLIGLVFLVVTGIATWRQGYRPARYYVIAWVIFLVGLILLGLKNKGVLQVNFVTNYSYLIGSALEVTLLSFALADRISILRLEKEEAQAETLGKERQVQEMLRHSKEELEIKVVQRTAELMEAKKVAEKATYLKDKFVSLVSHDLRSPLTMMRILLRKGLEKTGGAINPSAMEDISTAIEVSQEMDHYISSLLKVEKFKIGSLPIDKRPLNAYDFLENLKSGVTAEAQRKEVEIINEIPKAMVVSADKLLFGDVFSNLLLNAIKFTHKGGRITIYSPDNGHASISIADTGVGIPEENIKMIFDYEKMTSTPGTEGERGHGFGLPLCRDIINAHSGKIEVESTVGEGTVFCVYLPPLNGDDVHTGNEGG